MTAIALELIDRAGAERILEHRPSPIDHWAADYPLADELDALRMFLAQPDPVPAAFGLYTIRNLADGTAVGGIGFFGPPDTDGAVTVGYGLVPSARRRGFASEAVQRLVAVAAANGARRVHAVTDLDNSASQSVLLKNNFSELERDAVQAYFQLDLPA